MRIFAISIFCLLVVTCKTKEEDIINTKVYSSSIETVEKPQTYTERQKEIIEDYVYNCADKYSYKYNHHNYQECLNKGIEKDSQISYLWQQKAMPYFKARKYEVGMIYLDKAVKINRMRYLSYRGFMKCIFVKNYQGAIKDFEEIKALEGSSMVMDHSYDFYLGVSYLRLNDFEKAEALLQEDINAQVKAWGEKEYHHLSMFYLGIAQYEQKKWEQANRSFDKTLEKYTTFSDAMYYKSICLNRLGNQGEAGEWYQKAKVNGLAGNTISEDNSLYETYPYQILWN